MTAAFEALLHKKQLPLAAKNAVQLALYRHLGLNNDQKKLMQFLEVNNSLISALLESDPEV